MSRFLVESIVYYVAVNKSRNCGYSNIFLLHGFQLQNPVSVIKWPVCIFSKVPDAKTIDSIIRPFVFLPKCNYMDVKMDASWKEVLKNEFTKPYFLEIVTFLKMERSAGKTIFPPGPLIFNAFNQTPFDKVKVVIIGQDPYHNPEQAHGLSFSVPAGIKPPPSLANIYKEIQTDLGIAMPVNYGNLTRWAEQGVLLLNAMLTVRANEPASHAKIGWMNFTDAVIQKISDQKKGVVFLLWGKFAQEKQVLIDETKHFLLKAAHPSPFSVDKGFYGCKHFSKTNELLTQQGLPEIDWKLLTP